MKTLSNPTSDHPNKHFNKTSFFDAHTHIAAATINQTIPNDAVGIPPNFE
jgi:hypothetical protein